MAILKSLIVNGASKFIGDAYFNIIKSGIWNGSAIDLTHGGTAGTTTANKVLLSTTTNGASAWSSWTTAGFLKTNTSGVISIDNSTYLTSTSSLDPSKLSSAVPVNKGGTNITSWTAYAIPYASAATTIALLAPNTSTTTKFLSMTGTGSTGAAPIWKDFSDLASYIGDSSANATKTLSILKNAWSSSAISISNLSGTYAIQIMDYKYSIVGGVDLNVVSGKPLLYNLYSGIMSVNGSIGRRDEIALHSAMATSSDSEIPTRLYASTYQGGLYFASQDDGATNHYLKIKTIKLI